MVEKPGRWSPVVVGSSPCASASPCIPLGSQTCCPAPALPSYKHHLPLFSAASKSEPLGFS